MAQHFDKNSQVEDYKLRSKRLCVPLSIVHNATPASKSNSNDLGAALVLDLQGQLAASAIDSGCNFATPTDSTGVFGALMHNLGTVEKILKTEVVQLSSGTAVISLAGASSSGVTASGNIALSIDWSGDLTATDLSAVLIVEYRVSKA